MPIDKSAPITFRVDVAHDDGAQELLVLMCTEFSDKFLIAAEHGKETGKAHYQGVLYPKDTTTQHLVRVRIKKDFNVEKTQFSVGQVKKIDSYLSYLTKETVCFNQNIDLKTVKAWIPKEKVEKKPKAGNFFQVMLEDWHSEERSNEPREVFQYVYMYFVSNCKIFDKFIIERFANLLLAKVGKSTTVMHIIHKWSSDFDFKCYE